MDGDEQKARSLSAFARKCTRHTWSANRSAGGGRGPRESLRVSGRTTEKLMVGARSWSYVSTVCEWESRGQVSLRHGDTKRRLVGGDTDIDDLSDLEGDALYETEAAVCRCENKCK